LFESGHAFGTEEETDRRGWGLIIGMKIAGIESESIFTNEVSIDDAANEGSFGEADLSAEFRSAIEGAVRP
jgi:hypothetical protein